MPHLVTISTACCMSGTVFPVMVTPGRSGWEVAWPEDGPRAVDGDALQTIKNREREEWGGEGN